MAREAGIAPDTLRRVEQGRPVRVKTVRRIGRVLDVDPRTFAKAVSHWRSERA